MSDGLKLLGVLLENGSVSSLRQLKVDLFIDDEIPVYQFVRTHYRRYGQLPGVETVEDEVGVRFPNARETLDYYHRRIVDRKLFNEVSAEFATLRSSLKTREMEAVRESIGRMRGVVREQSQDEDPRNFREVGSEVAQDYDDAKNAPGLTGIPSGWRSFDDQTGGYQSGDLISLVARLGMGKTYLLLAQALYAYEMGHSVLVVSMEMTIRQIGRRLAGMYAGVNPEHIRKGRLSTYAERRLRGYMSGLSHADRFNLYAGGFNKKVEDIEILIQEFSPDMVYIDGGYLLRPEVQRNMGRNERVAEVMDVLKRMTLTQERPIFQTSQFSRQAGKKGKEGSLENIGFTDAIGTHSSIVLGVKEGKPPNISSRRVIDVMKGREGEHGEFQVYYRFNPINFGEVPMEVTEGERGDMDWTADGPQRVAAVPQGEQ